MKLKSLFKIIADTAIQQNAPVTYQIGAFQLNYLNICV